MNQLAARIQFANWLKSEHPAIFNRAVEIAAKSENAELGAMGEAKESFWSKFGKAAVGLGTTYLTLKNQRDAMKINLERARQGQPPIDVATAAPVVRTQVEVSPELAKKLTDTAGEGLSNMTIWVIAAIAAGFFLVGGRRRK